MQSPVSKPQILQLVRSEADALEALVGGLSDARLAEPGVSGQWSVKDILAHLTWWQLHMLKKLDNQQPPFALPGEDHEDTIVRINGEVYRAHRDQTAAETRAAFLAANRHAQETLSGCTEELLLAHREDIACDTWDHFAEHRASIEQWLAGSPKLP
jgi:hypothetical protein